MRVFRLLWLVSLLSAAAPAQCTYSLSPGSAQVGANGGSLGPIAMTVVSGSNCTRAVTSNDSWITIGFGATGTGNGTFGYSVDPNTAGAPRTGTITAAGQTFTVTQAAASVTLSATSATFPASGGSGSFAVSSSNYWAAQPTVSWVHITANPTGVPGSTTVTYSVDGNSSTAARDGAIQVAGSSLAVHEAGVACTATLSAATANVGAAGGVGSVSVTGLAAGCTATVTSNASWITATAGANNVVSYNVAANTGTQARTGTVLIVDKTFTITQAGQAGCTVTTGSAAASFSAAGGNGTVAITAPAGCSWTASSDSDWLKVVSGAGSGSGVVSYTAAANAGSTSRTGKLTIGGGEVVVTQSAPDPNAVLLTGVLNAASYQGGGVSPGEFVVLFGVNIGPATFAFASVQNNRFGTTAGGARVLFDGVAAPLYYAGANQTVAIVPYSVFGKTQTQVQVEYQGTKSNAVAMDVVDAAPGIFTQAQSGSGAGSILNPNFSVNSSAKPAARGTTVAVFATGEGQTNPGGSDGLVAVDALPKPLLDVTATVGGVPAMVQYAGAAPSLVAGVLQVNVTIPDGAPSGNAALVVKVGAKSSQPGVTVAVQ
jgi:uncharacterized protein (TIGR03437 family)